jgi:hypothetical protein
VFPNAPYWFVAMTSQEISCGFSREAAARWEMFLEAAGVHRI